MKPPFGPRLSVVNEAAERVGSGMLEWHRAGGAEAGLGRLRDAARRAGTERLTAALETEEAERFFSFLFGNSPHLARTVVRDPRFAERLTTEDSTTLIDALLNDLGEADPAWPRSRLMRFLRRRRAHAAVLAAVLDCFEIRDVMECARLLSDVADHSVRLAMEHLLLDRERRGDLKPEARKDGSKKWGLFALALGKHGSRELNYSSDVDLIILYDPVDVTYAGRRSSQDCFVRICRDLTRILNARTADGYVFRVDLRLRPDASSTPPAITTDFALRYYREFGRTWERAAFIKARPVGGDVPAGERFLGRMESFVWGQGFDFGSVDEIRAMSQQIHDFHGHGAIRAEGHDVKLGRGGIREIEFFVHMHQLVFGRDKPRLRGASVPGMLRVLEEDHHILPAEAATLLDGYHFLRRVEHRLQMINDDQTQKLPATQSGMEHVARFLRLGSADELSRRVAQVSGDAHRVYSEKFSVGESDRDVAARILDGPEGSPDALKTLEEAGFEKPKAALAIFRGWAEGRYVSTSSAAARTALREILEEAVAAFGKTPYPDRALARMDQFLAAIPEDMSFFSLLRSNAWLLNLMAVIMGSAPRIAGTLSHAPGLLAQVLDPGFFMPVAKEDLDGELAQRMERDRGKEPEDAIESVAEWTQARRFQVGAQALSNLVTVEESSDSLSRIAELALSALLDVATREAGEAIGRESAGFAVVALGKLGALEMTFESDLDLVFVLDQRDSLGGADASMRFFSKAARHLIGALRRRFAGQRLYEVDMRLRPLGDSGPLVTTLESLRQYQLRSAWTWEHMSLTRARAIAGDAAARKTVDDLIAEVVQMEREPQTLLNDVARMRIRIEAEHHSEDPFELKYVRGGIVDLEFIAQYLVLKNARERPEVAATGTAACFGALERAGILSSEDAGFLVKAILMHRALQSLLRLTWSAGTPVAEAPEALGARIARSMEFGSMTELEAALRETQAGVRGYFQELIASKAS